MKKTLRSDIAAFPELFNGVEEFIEELGRGIRQTSVKLAVIAIPGSALALFALSKAG